MTKWYVTTHEDDSRHYDVLEYDGDNDVILMAILKGNYYEKTVYVSNKEFGRLLRKRDYKSVTLNSKKRTHLVLKYNANVDLSHPLYPVVNNK